jgi:hypothetical protein
MADGVTSPVDSDMSSAADAPAPAASAGPAASDMLDAANAPMPAAAPTAGTSPADSNMASAANAPAAAAAPAAGTSPADADMDSSANAPPAPGMEMLPTDSPSSCAVMSCLVGTTCPDPVTGEVGCFANASMATDSMPTGSMAGMTDSASGPAAVVALGPAPVVVTTPVVTTPVVTTGTTMGDAAMRERLGAMASGRAPVAGMGESAASGDDEAMAPSPAPSQTISFVV